MMTDIFLIHSHMKTNAQMVTDVFVSPTYESQGTDGDGYILVLQDELFSQGSEESLQGMFAGGVARHVRVRYFSWNNFRNKLNSCAVKNAENSWGRLCLLDLFLTRICKKNWNKIKLMFKITVYHFRNLPTISPSPLNHVTGFFKSFKVFNYTFLEIP